MTSARENEKRKKPTGLTLHWPYARILKEQPVVHLIVLPCAFGKAHLVLGIIPINQIVHDAARLKQSDHLTILKSIRQSWNTAVGIDSTKLGVCVSAAE